MFFTTDINPHACDTTKQTGIKNGVDRIEPIQTSLVNGFLPRLEGLVDVLCFNPPYVVTTPEEVGSHGIEASWAGGIDGRQVIDEFLPFVPVSGSLFLFHCHILPILTHSPILSQKRLLSPDGVFYLLLINENRPNQVAEILRGEHGMHADIIMERRAGRERQYILKITHPSR